MAENAFFEVGKTYTDPVGQDIYKAPEEATVFRCDAIISHPFLDLRLAIGWAKPGATPDSEYLLAAYPEASWSSAWTEGDKWRRGGAGG